MNGQEYKDMVSTRERATVVVAQPANQSKLNATAVPCYFAPTFHRSGCSYMRSNSLTFSFDALALDSSCSAEPLLLGFLSSV